MKTSFITTTFLLLIAVIGFAYAVNAQNNQNATEPHNILQAETYPLDDFYFSTDYVVDVLSYDDAYFVVYYDMDAGMNYEMIRLRKDAFNKVVEAWNAYEVCTGTLKGNKPYESVEYDIEFDNWQELKPLNPAYTTKTIQL